MDQKTTLFSASIIFYDFFHIDRSAGSDWK